MQADPYSTIFLLVNSASGGGMGTKLLSQEIQKIQFYLSIEKDHHLVEVYFFDLLTRKEKAFTLLRQYTTQNKPVISIVCGGDGTIMWVVSELSKFKIDPMKVAIGVLPLGTGNDFSQFLGWGKEKTQLVQNNFKSLKKLIRKWLVAKTQEFDIWDVKATVFENGKFEKINKRGESQVLKDREGGKATSICYSFCNYFSFGIDGKIGYSFDKRRTGSRIGNLMVYGTMGLLKAASKTKTLQQLVQQMEIIHDVGSEVIEPQPFLEKPREHIKQQIASSPTAHKRLKQDSRSDDLIFRSKITLEKSERKKKLSELYLEHDYYNLVVLNINSFMGGVKDIWEKAKDQELNCKEKAFSEVSSNDGQLEFMCFSSSVGMAMERIFGGFATRITQGGGPFLISFNRYQHIEKHRTYLQIDGEFIRFTHPETVTISKSQLGRNGKIKVIRRNIQGEQGLNL